MFYNTSKREKEDRLIRVKKLRDKFLGKIPLDPYHDTINREQVMLVKQYMDFLKLSPDQQGKIRKEWEVYYSLAEESPAGLIWYAIRDAARKKEWKKVKELSLTAREMKKNGHAITLEKPLSIDTYEIDHGLVIRSYLACLREIKGLEDELLMPQSQEAQAIWEE